MTHMERIITSLDSSPGLIAKFECEWIEAWNAHDVDWILAHYRHDIRFISPFAARAGAPHGELRGRRALRDYFKRALASYPALHFEPIAALGGIRSIALHYRSVEDRQAIEVMELDARGQVRYATAHYTPPLGIRGKESMGKSSDVRHTPLPHISDRPTTRRRAPAPSPDQRAHPPGPEQSSLEPTGASLAPPCDSGAA